MFRRDLYRVYKYLGELHNKAPIHDNSFYTITILKP